MRTPAQSAVPGRLASLLAVWALILASVAGAAQAAAGGGTRAGTGMRTAQDPEIWITMDAKELETMRSEAQSKADLARLPEAIESFDGVAISRIHESDIDLLASLIHERFNRCGGFMAHASFEEALDVLYGWTRPEPLFVNYTIDNAPTVQALMAQVNASNIFTTINVLSTNTNTRHRNSQAGVTAANWLKGHWQALAAGRNDIRVELFSHSGFIQPSVIATVVGSDPVLAKEIVVVGGHLDSVRSGQPATADAPGADDDASGIASITEVFRALVATGYRPARTVKFMAYAGEEGGLLGSKDIATRLKATPTSRNVVIGAFQLDMTNFRNSAPDAVDVGVLTDTAHTDATQTQFVRDLLVTYLPSLTWANTTCGYGCSDHSSWKIQGGVPASMAFEGRFGQHNQALHTANDTLATMGNNTQHAAKFSKLAAAYVAELAKGTIPPPVEGKRARRAGR